MAFPRSAMLEVGTLPGLILAIAALYLGRWCNRRAAWLQEWHIPPAVTGGLIGNGVLMAIAAYSGQALTFETDLRDFLLLAFFCTVGLEAQLRLLRRAGRTVGVLIAVSVAFLMVQNAIGLGTARLLGKTLVYGLLAGSVAFAGGHGTAIGWGQFLRPEVPDALEYGVAAATLGLILGGLGGGAIAQRLIRSKQLQGEPVLSVASDAPQERSPEPDLLLALLAIVGCIVGGSWANGWLQQQGLTCPAFLPVAIAGVLLGNGLTVAGRTLDERAVGLWGGLSLELFLTMSLLGLQFGALSEHWGMLLAIAGAQLLATLAFGYWAIFPAAGSDYTASVLVAGFVGVGLGATPVGMANMHAVTARYGAAMEAFVILPLVWAVFGDILNAAVVRTLLAAIG